MVYTHRCTLCLRSNKIKDCASDHNMRSHLGAPSTHNMGPFECQIPGCGLRSQRQDRNNNHGNHQAVWAQPQALITALNREVQACQQALINAAAAPVPPVAAAANVVPPVVVPAVAVPPATVPPVAIPPVVAAATAAPPVAAATNVAPAVVPPAVVGPPQAVPTGASIAAAQGLNAVQGPPASVQGPPTAAQVPLVAVPTVQVPDPVPAAQVPAATTAADAGDDQFKYGHFKYEMDNFELRHAGETRDDIEAQYEKEQKLWYQLDE
ncbi:unnamed protein product [Aureobasidium mustum]|uniref:Uncharacterized protein n=1 Tax=Aureobasidium mustum TaxID=2773714 RepID=A0A9N8JTG8_9PEZI|nr:unnamed protein product [Aureobasidium mustum]